MLAFQLYNCYTLYNFMLLLASHDCHLQGKKKRSHLYQFFKKRALERNDEFQCIVAQK